MTLVVLASLAWAMGSMLVCIALLEAIEIAEMIGRRPREADARPVREGAASPFVSLHVPICSEPPDVVARTLRALHVLRYDAYEVLVIDNNTADERLWLPVQQLCNELGPRFRFYHLPRWPGFKGGALNFALRHTAPQATIIGVIDSDYEVFPTYLSDLAPFLADPEVAFVQAPQDYRCWSHSSFLRMCYWEFWQFFAVSMRLRDRRNAILMHGTMGLIHKRAVERAGGWAEWCMTEDSELGLRLLALGYRGIYRHESHGRGLMPFTFEAYKRQRRRWVIGGAQQLMRHWRLFLPGGASGFRLSAAQRLHYLQGWLPWFRDGVVVLAMGLAAAMSGAALFGLVHPSLVEPIGIGMAATLLHLLVRQFVICRLHLRLPWRDVLGAAIAIASLTLTVGAAWLRGLISSDRIFQRTPKKPAQQRDQMHRPDPAVVVGIGVLLLGAAMLVQWGLAAVGATTALWASAALLLPAAWMARASARDMAGEVPAVQ